MEPLNFGKLNRDTNETTYKFPSSLPPRPGFNTKGKAIQIQVNQYKVTAWPQKDVYQYDVSCPSSSPSNLRIRAYHFQINIGNGAEKRGLVKKVWECNTVQNVLKKHSGGMPWLWDGNKLAW